MKAEDGRMIEKKLSAFSSQRSAFNQRTKTLNTKDFRLPVEHDDCRSKADVSLQRARTRHADHAPASQEQGDQKGKPRFVLEKNSHHAMIIQNACSICQ